MNGRLTRQFEAWMDSALEKHGLEDRFVYELQVQLDQQQQPVMMVMMFLPGMILNSWVQTGTGIQNLLMVTEKDIEVVVKQLTEGLRKGRSDQGHSVQVEGNGDGGEVTAEILRP